MMRNVDMNERTAGAVVLSAVAIITSLGGMGLWRRLSCARHISLLSTMKARVLAVVI